MHVTASARRGMLLRMPADPADPAREAAAAAALERLERLEPGATIGLGSGRAVWKVVDAVAARWPEGPPFVAAVASELTDSRARAAGIKIVELDGSIELELAVDGADEVDPELRLLKGGGGALLREKIVVSAARRFVVVAEEAKRVERLGAGFRLPVEVVRFAWRDTRRRLAAVLPDSELRSDGDEPFVTDEGHYLLDCALPAEADLDQLDSTLERIAGIVEHGLFIGMADEVLLGRQDGACETVSR
ncbi:MAG: ribose-5-phosphate isomerase RpiA [Thermoleophilaceae bacterium]